MLKYGKLIKKLSLFIIQNKHFLARTIKGFLSVIQREWIEAGHPFYDRLQRSAWAPRSATTGKEGSTWFLFLHAVNHLLLTHPIHFQVSPNK